MNSNVLSHSFNNFEHMTNLFHLYSSHYPLSLDYFKANLRHGFLASDYFPQMFAEHLLVASSFFIFDIACLCLLPYIFDSLVQHLLILLGFSMKRFLYWPSLLFASVSLISHIFIIFFLLLSFYSIGCSSPNF